LAIGVDIGGSGVRAARVREGATNGPIVKCGVADRSVASVLSAVEEVVAELGGGADVGVGVGVPGFVRDGTVLRSPNFPEWRDVPFRRLLSDRLRLDGRVEVANDANVAALGAWAARGSRGDLVLLTLGTGVGGGVISGGRLLTGSGGTGAELGHIFVGGDRACGCGGVGCLETWCSTVGLVAAAREVGREVVHGRQVVEAAREGEGWALAVLDGAALALGRGLTTLVNLFNPAVVVLSGGVSQASDLLGPPALAYLRAHGVPPSVDSAEIVWAGRAESFAIVGAAALLSQPEHGWSEGR
jgi:glucokinase